ncbi:MAG: glycosyltransferase family 9 protein [Pseudomonadota bacterium]
MSDSRPKTVVLHQFTGIGDLVWHIPYFKAVAEQSRGGKVSVIAQPSTLARQLIGHEPWVEEIIDHDHRPRRSEKRKGRHAGLLGMWRFAQELKQRDFDRIVLFSGRVSRGLLAWMTGIPVRVGYGYRLLQRVFLTRGPYITPYRGSGVAAYHEATEFAVAQRFVDKAISPRLDLPSQLPERVSQILSGMRRPVYALAIGTSEPYKQWGEANFSDLARRLLQDGGSVLALGGAAERELATKLLNNLPEGLRSHARAVTHLTVRESASLLAGCDLCIGNDTGMVNVSAAVGCPTIVLLGPRPALAHDPSLICLTSSSLRAITVEEVYFASSQRLSYSKVCALPLTGVQAESIAGNTRSAWQRPHY